jgi:hypothetical protein
VVDNTGEQAAADAALVRAAQGGDTLAMNDLLDRLVPYVGRMYGSIALDVAQRRPYRGRGPRPLRHARPVSRHRSSRMVLAAEPIPHHRHGRGKRT